MISRLRIFLWSFVFFPALASAQILDGRAGVARCNFSAGISCSFCDIVIILANLYFIVFDTVFRIGILVIMAGVIIIFSKKFDEKWVERSEKAIKWSVIILVIAMFSWFMANTILYFLSDENSRQWGEFNCSMLDASEKTIDFEITKNVIEL